MNTAIESAKEGINTLIDMPLLFVAVLALNVLGWLAKSVPILPNKYIPAIIILGGGALGFFLVPLQGPADWAFQVSNPEAADIIRRTGIGLVVGFIAWLFHKTVLWRLEGWIRNKFGNGDRALTREPREPGK